METEKTQFDKQISALVQEPDHIKMLCAVQDKLDRANDALTQMVESRKEYYDFKPCLQ